MNGCIIKNTNETNIDISISKDKYKFFNEINENKLEYVIDEIIEIGYTYYIKNFIKNGYTNANGNDMGQLHTQTNNITQSKISALKGAMGEELVMNIIIDKFNNLCVENTSKIPHSGDIQIRLPSGNVVIIEVKNYNKTIEQDQIEKLKFDMVFNNVRGAIFISLNSGIVGKKKFDFEIFNQDCKEYYIIFIPYSMHKSIPEKKNLISHNNIEDSTYNLSLKLEYALCIIQNIIDRTTNNIIGRLKNISQIEIDFMISQFNQIYNDFKLIKNSFRLTDENIKKNLLTHQNTLIEFEKTFTNRISELISSKLYTKQFNNLNKKNIKIKKNNFNSYDVLIDNILSGMIIEIDNVFDVLIIINANIINKQFDNFYDCKTFTKSI